MSGSTNLFFTRFSLTPHTFFLLWLFFVCVLFYVFFIFRFILSHLPLPGLSGGSGTVPEKWGLHPFSSSSSSSSTTFEGDLSVCGQFVHAVVPPLLQKCSASVFLVILRPASEQSPLRRRFQQEILRGATCIVIGAWFGHGLSWI